MIKIKHKEEVLILTREEYPAYRVDVSHLFSDLLSKYFKFTWLMNGKKNIDRKIIKNAQGEDVYINPKFLIKDKTHKALINLIRKKKFKLIICRDAFLIAPIYLIISKLYGIPFVYWMSYPMELGYINRGLSNLKSGNIFSAFIQLCIGFAGKASLYLFTLLACEHIFVQSKEMKSYVKKKLILSKNITDVPMGIDIDNFSSEKVEAINYPFYDKKRIILYTGTIDESRSMNIPSSAVAQFCSETNDVIFAVIGKNSEKERDIIINEFALYNAQNKLHFIDFMPINEMMQHVKRADLCFAPYPNNTPLLNTSSPTKLIEYLAMGKSIVANNHPEQTFIGNHNPKLITLCEFSKESFYLAIKKGLDSKKNSHADINNSISWIKANRSYEVISKKVLAKLKLIIER